ncbi:MAG: hypothetical protein WCG27_06500 [Pseudomonadota bacterium]
MSVGDGDSYPYALDIQLPREKDFSDLAYALTLIPPHLKKIYTLGPIGGRKDHELFNLGEIHHALKLHLNKTLFVIEENLWAIPQGKHSFPYHGLFSILAMEEVLLELTGDIDYPLPQNYQLQPFSSRGLSNLAHGQIELKCSGPLFLFWGPDKEFP